MTPNTASILLRTTAATALLAITPGLARAQNALGDGRRLERNPQLGSGGRNTPGRDIMEQTRLNNAIITGNAPDGRSFHGYVGYLATDDFRAALGSNDLYRFQRDTARNELATQGIRGTDALRYQFSLATGQAPPTMMGQEIGYVARSGAAGGTLASALRSTSDYLSQQSTRPGIVGYQATKDGYYAVTASPLLGVGVVQLTPPNSTLTPPTPPVPELTPQTGPQPINPGPTPVPAPGTAPAPDAQRVGGGLSGVEAGGRGVANPLTISRALDRAAAKTRVETRVELPAAVAEPLKANLEPGEFTTRIKTGKPEDAAPGEPPEGTPKAAWEIELDRLRRQLAGQAEPQTGIAAKPPTIPGLETPGEPGTQPAPAPKPRERSALTPEAQAVIDPQLAKVDPRILTAIQRTRPTLTRLSGPERPQTTQSITYKSYMDAGQDFLAQGRYFDAEDRFLRALAAMPRDAMAQIGRVHAQLGAGLYLSAATNLRTIFVDHPEIVGVHYDATLLPTVDRSETMARQLRESMKVKGSTLGRDAALLLAYLGYQRRDAAMTQEGITALADWVEQGDEAAATLVGLLEKVWIEGERDRDQPPDAAPAAPAPEKPKDTDQNK